MPIIDTFLEELELKAQAHKAYAKFMVHPRHKHGYATYLGDDYWRDYDKMLYFRGLLRTHTKKD